MVFSKLGHISFMFHDAFRKEGMDANAHRVRFANYLPVAITLLAKLARRKGWLKDNPAAEIELMKVPAERKKPHIPWTDTAVETWRHEANDLPMLIFELGVGSVQRPGDLNGFTWCHYDGRNLKLSQNKTGVELLLPCTPSLKAKLDDAKFLLGNDAHPDRPILANEDGSAMNYFKIARIMRDERKRLGVLEHDLHALRYRGVMELAWAGCDDDEIMSYSGHKTKKMVIKYAGFARQIMRASTAAEKRRLSSLPPRSCSSNWRTFTTRKQASATQAHSGWRMNARWAAQRCFGI